MILHTVNTLANALEMYLISESKYQAMTLLTTNRENRKDCGSDKSHILTCLFCRWLTGSPHVQVNHQALVSLAVLTHSFPTEDVTGAARCTGHSQARLG